MRRLTEAWFEFKGRRSDEMGILLKQMPVRSLPGRNITRKRVSGRNGSLKYGDRTYKDVKVRLECDIVDESRVPDILAWLTGDGRLRFSDEPTLEYQAGIDEEYSRSSIQARLTGQRFTITWVCEPFRYQYPEPEPIITSASNISINNHGTAPSLPRIEIIGSGDFALTIGMQTLYFLNVEDGIIVDSELGNALTLDGANLANDKISGDLFEIQPGYNVISWLTGGENGSGYVDKVTITPRWRFF